MQKSKGTKDSTKKAIYLNVQYKVPKGETVISSYFQQPDLHAAFRCKQTVLEVSTIQSQLLYFKFFEIKLRLMSQMGLFSSMGRRG